MLEKRDVFVCALEPCKAEVFCQQVVVGIQVYDMDVKDTVIALLSEKSANSKQLYQLLLKQPGMTPLTEKKQKLWLTSDPQASPVKSVGICSVSLYLGINSLHITCV